MKKSSLTLKLINAPYMIWAVLFILAPLIMVIYYAFTDRSGAFTLDNIKRFHPTELSSADLRGMRFWLRSFALFLHIRSRILWQRAVRTLSEP